MKQIAFKKSLHFQDGEVVLQVVRKHWFALLSDSIGVLLAAIAPFIIIPLIAPYVNANPAFIVFIISLWLLIALAMLFTVWTNYYLDIWIVTDKRIINIDQLHLFNRNVSTLRMERVQDIKVEKYGIFSTIFDFGNLQVQTAGPESSFYYINGIPNPSKIRNTILEQVDMTTEHKNRLEYNTEQRPSESE